MKSLRRYNRQSGTTKRKIARILAERERWENDHARRHAMEVQWRYEECARRALA